MSAKVHVGVCYHAIVLREQGCQAAFPCHSIDSRTALVKVFEVAHGLFVQQTVSDQ